MKSTYYRFNLRDSNYFELVDHIDREVASNTHRDDFSAHILLANYELGGSEFEVLRDFVNDVYPKYKKIQDVHDNWQAGFEQHRNRSYLEASLVVGVIGSIVGYFVGKDFSSALNGLALGMALGYGLERSSHFLTTQKAGILPKGLLPQYVAWPEKVETVAKLRKLGS